MASATLIRHCSSPLHTVSQTSPFCNFKHPIFPSLTLVPQLGLVSFSSWNGLKRNGLSISLKSLKFEKKKKCGGKGVFASLFGVGAPEALVVGVVALLVFGPKGLAEIAKNMGKTLRAFQPTIAELQEVSREFKSTLEKEIGLDELKNPGQVNTSTIPTLSSSTLSVAPPENSPAIATETATAATTGDSEMTATPPIAITEDSQASTTSLAATNEDLQAVATTPAVITEDSQPTIDSSSFQDVAVGSEVRTVV